MKTIRLTKLSGKKSHSSSLEIGESIDGNIEKGWMFPMIPTIGRPFVISTYRTGIVDVIITDSMFETQNSRYHWKEI